MQHTIFFPVRPAVMMTLMLSGVLYVNAQPYVDPLQVRYTYGMRNAHSMATPFTHLWAGSDLPIKLKENTYLLVSPYYDQWQFDSASTKEIFPRVEGFALPVGLIMPTNNPKWSLTVLPIVRNNAETLFAEDTWQFGGILFGTYTRKPQQKFRLGFYANAEFFGFFFVPLFGADWKLGEKDHLFGLLPGRLTWEHKLNKSLFYGATFRAMT
ncbi:MAG TPA: hypothetical protein VK907_10630, partial [Phnomibacter sp.]|nr:hypothetical protein [Phnomibacter sp.]